MCTRENGSIELIQCGGDRVGGKINIRAHSSTGLFKFGLPILQESVLWVAVAQVCSAQSARKRTRGSLPRRRVEGIAASDQGLNNSSSHGVINPNKVHSVSATDSCTSTTMSADGSIEVISHEEPTELD